MGRLAGSRAPRISLWLFGLALVGPACSSAKKARELSEGVVDQIEAEFELLDERHPATVWGAALLDQIVTASAKHQNPRGYEYRLRVIEDPLPNAFTTPAGHIYLTTGLLATARSCAEIAGILGHEVGHVIEHHAVKRLRDTEAAGCMGEMVFGRGGASDAFAIGGMILANTSFSREDEHEADEIGVQLAAEVGYAPEAIIDFFERTAPQQTEVGFWSTHPAGAERVAAVRALIEELPASAQDLPRDCPSGALDLATVQARLE